MPTISTITLFTSHISASVCCCRGSRFDLTVPWKRVGSWGIILSLDRKSCNPISDISTPSMIIRPADGSTIRNKAWMRVDFPLPVRPTTPTFLSPGNVQLIPLRTIGMSWLYLIWRPSIWIVPYHGHLSIGLYSSITKGDSLGMFENCRILSTEIILFSTSHKFHITHACKTLRLRP